MCQTGCFHSWALRIGRATAKLPRMVPQGRRIPYLVAVKVAIEWREGSKWKELCEPLIVGLRLHPSLRFGHLDISYRCSRHYTFDFVKNWLRWKVEVGLKGVPGWRRVGGERAHSSGPSVMVRRRGGRMSRCRVVDWVVFGWRVVWVEDICFVLFSLCCLGHESQYCPVLRLDFGI